MDAVAGPSQRGRFSKSDDDEYVEITLDLRGDDSPPLNGRNYVGTRKWKPWVRSGSALVAPSQRGRFSDDDDYVEITLDHQRDDSPLNGLSFVGAQWPWDQVKKEFNQLSVDGCLRRSMFGKCIGLHGSDEFAVQLFDALAWRQNLSRSWITQEELEDFYGQISNITFDGRLQIFLDMMFKNTDGRATEKDMTKMIAMSASANKLPKIEEQASDYARLIMEDLDPKKLGYIDLQQLKALLLKHASWSQLPRAGPTDDNGNLPSQSLRPVSELNPLRRWFSSAQYFVEEHWRRLWVMLLWLSICVGLFTWKFVQYRRRYVFQVMGYCVCVAKGGAETLKFNMALIMLPVCRNTITWIRDSTFISRAVPVDDNIKFHEVIAVGITIGTGLHIFSHLTCNFPRLLRATDAGYAPLAQFFSTSHDWRPPSYWWFLRGIEGWTGLVMLVLMLIAFTLALPSLRHGRVRERLPSLLKRLTGFNAFWYSHHLLVIVYTLLIVHGHFLYLTHKWYNKSTWMYLAVPMLLYTSERLTRALRSSMLPIKILKVMVYPGDTLSLHFSKPQGFRYKSGQYIFLNCPTISPFQWHPFCITSAPHDNYLSVHIRTDGDWTGKLKDIIFSEVCRPPVDYEKSGFLQAEYDHDKNVMSSKSLPKVLIDGPYGLMAHNYMQYEAVLLISIGIGVTPMISILKDIINNKKQLHGDLESGDNTNSMSSSPFRMQKVYFYWVTRDHGFSDWFHSVMDEVAEMEKMGVIEFHTYFTSIYEEGDVRSTLIAMLQSLNYDKYGVDIVSGTRVKTHFARPNWRNVYKHITLNHLGERVGKYSHTIKYDTICH